MSSSSLLSAPACPAAHPDRTHAMALVAGLALVGVFASGTAQAAPPAPVQCPAGWVSAPAGVNPALRCLPQSLVAELPNKSAPPAKAPACPSGWQAVSPAVNPILHCQPQVVRPKPGAPAAAKTDSCPTGWTPVAATVNPLLRCLPEELAAFMPKPLASTRPPTCPTGWKAVMPGSHPLMRCLPVTAPAPEPMQGGPGTGDPGQGRDVQAAKAGAMDLALADNIRIGPVSVAWGGNVDLAASSASSRKDGACHFRVAYRTRNQGIAGTQATVNRIHRDAKTGPALSSQALAALAPGQIATTSGVIALKPGTWLLVVHADATGVVKEIDEANNLRQVRVKVTGNCSA